MDKIAAFWCSSRTKHYFRQHVTYRVRVRRVSSQTPCYARARKKFNILFIIRYYIQYTIYIHLNYKSSLTPNPGPYGVLFKLVNPVIGSAAYRSIRGPGLGFFPDLKSSKISSMSLAFKSS